jgi:hypothetical protein
MNTMKKPDKDSKKTKKESPKNISSVESLTHLELSGEEDKRESIDASETDEDENEGLGDGNLGIKNPDILEK